MEPNDKMNSNLFFTAHFEISIECLIPTLNVQELDRKLIERKRQDTYDMCRMFTEENERLELFKTGVGNHNRVENRKRIKRNLKPENYSVNIENAKRIENIVDKIYDDMAAHGEKVTYRQRELYSTTVKVSSDFQNKSARRFEFAPAMLLPPLSTPKTRVPMFEENNYNIPWKKRWKHGIVPFFIDSKTYDSHLSEIIIKAFDYFEKATCIRLQRLRERPTDKESLQNVEWLYITNPSGIRQCVHSNERKENKGVQMVVFGYDCLSLGEIVHEVMHILGFSHEHTRPDRDQYITVLWDNIKPGYKKYFEIRSEDPLITLPYDYASILHYPPRSFSKNGQLTLMTEAGVKIGQREGLSDVDITKVTTIYGSECMDRNRQYLLKTCPSVVKPKSKPNNTTQKEIEDYFKDRLWPYGIVNYSIKDKMEFSIEERENIDAVIRHIEKETCIEFRDVSVYDVDDDVNTDDQNAILNTDEEKNNKKQTMTVDDQKSDSKVGNEISSDTKSLSKLKNIQEYRDSWESGSDDLLIGSEKDQPMYKRRKNVDAKQAKLSSDFNKSLAHLKDFNSSYTSGSLPKAPEIKRIRRNAAATVSPGRRHAESTLTIVRSLEPGCHCPPPGKPEGDKALKINADCFNSVNDLLHLFVHVLGLDHQHNMHDRDSFLHILWDNLTPDIKEEMEKKLPPAAAVGFPYDYQSVMHYPWLQIKDGVTNIMYPIWNDGWAMGHWQGLSATDVNKLNLIYSEQCSLRKKHAQE